ncbi:MAG: hypothetical protein ACI9ND_002318 [Yoonia sp.]|jgi:hypothetical protein
MLGVLAWGGAIFGKNLYKFLTKFAASGGDLEGTKEVGPWFA